VLLVDINVLRDVDINTKYKGGCFMNKVNEAKGVMHDSFSGTSAVIKKYSFEVSSLAIANDGNADVELDLGYCQVTVKPDEVFDDNIVPQRGFMISATDKFRCIVRGEY
jgi:hypothetical protein